MAAINVQQSRKGRQELLAALWWPQGTFRNLAVATMYVQRPRDGCCELPMAPSWQP